MAQVTETTTLLPPSPPPRTDAERPSRFVIVLAAFAAIGGFLFGYDTGVISGALLVVKEEFDLSSIQQEWVVASATAGAMLGAMTGGYLNDRLGRRLSTMIGAVVFALGSVVMGFASTGLCFNRLFLIRQNIIV